MAKQKAVSKAGQASTVEPDDSPKWTFFTNHAHVLILLHQDAELVLREIALRVGITERAVQRIVQDLEDGGFIERERVGRRNHYRVIRDRFLRHPIESHCKIDQLIELIIKSA
ncbi:MAG: winged helix-turn-helix transcriptional regulator [Pirellulaceae bacterium]